MKPEKSMALHGKNIIAGDISGEGGKTFTAKNPSLNVAIEPAFHEATPLEIERAMAAAKSACDDFRRRAPAARANFLDRIGTEIMALDDALLQRAQEETGLPKDRLTGERARTVGQLSMNAALIREGSWVEATIDRAQSERKPLPKPDLRRMLIPLGPVIVFGSSNFPFAYSTAGGDTASALAAGNPVVVKAHPAHPGTNELVAGAIARAAAATGMPAGVFSMLHGASNEVGIALVRDPVAQAVGFTGSLKGGRALFDAAASRPQPIPVYAEMGSANPVFILPGALAERAEAIAAGLKQSVTLGVGQFCTCPGLVIGIGDAQFKNLQQRVAALIGETAPGTMLHAGILQAYQAGTARAEQRVGKPLGRSTAEPDAQKTQAAAMVFGTDAAKFLKDPSLGEEIFGPATVMISCASAQELEQVARRLDGHLTATIHANAQDLDDFKSLTAILETKVGRLVYNGFPTGVEVCAAMTHGGPYPATTDARSTSVGPYAIKRFVRPISYQNYPESALPDELRDANPRKIWRLVENKWTRD
jgi:NADP-dependent aldehyde dehydrogenase